MLIVIIGICIAVIFVACLIGDRVSTGVKLENFCCASAVISGIIGVVALLLILVSIVTLAGSGVVDEKIRLYEDANIVIEEHINDAVEDYKVYENDTLEKFEGKSGIEIVSFYPDLKANELIQEQMEIYYQNQTTILSLQEEKLSYKPWRWWLYFGG